MGRPTNAELERRRMESEVKEIKEPSAEDNIRLEMEELRKKLRTLEETYGTTPEDPKELRPFLVNLAPHSQGYIDYNGTRYYQNKTYMVDYGLYCSLAEIQGNTWKHEKTLHEQENPYRRKLNRSI